MTCSVTRGGTRQLKDVFAIPGLADHIASTLTGDDHMSLASTSKNLRRRVFTNYKVLDYDYGKLDERVSSRELREDKSIVVDDDTKKIKQGAREKVRRRRTPEEQKKSLAASRIQDEGHWYIRLRHHTLLPPARRQRKYKFDPVRARDELLTNSAYGVGHPRTRDQLAKLEWLSWLTVGSHTRSHADGAEDEEGAAPSDAEVEQGSTERMANLVEGAAAQGVTRSHPRSHHAFTPRPTPRAHTRVHTQTELKTRKVHLEELQRKV